MKPYKCDRCDEDGSRDTDDDHIYCDCAYGTASKLASESGWYFLNHAPKGRYVRHDCEECQAYGCTRCHKNGYFWQDTWADDEPDEVTT